MNKKGIRVLSLFLGTLMAGFTVAANVVSEQKTVSPAFTLASFITRCSAAVPADRARQ